MERLICNQVIMREVAHELGLPLDTVKLIVNIQVALIMLGYLT
jgi:hypothetical protein